MEMMAQAVGGCILFVLFFSLAHAFKAARLYLVLMEEGLPLKDYLSLYARTTLANLVIPFKLGEIYRIAAVYRVTGRGVPSILSVCIDRFFDTAALLAIIIPVGFLFGERPGNVSLLLALGLIFILLVYLIFIPSYRYLNEYVIMHKRSERSIRSLEYLKNIKIWHDFASGLIKGRAPLVVLISFLGWGAEFIAIKSFCAMTGIGFYMEDLIDYIDSIFSPGSGGTAFYYNAVGAGIFVVLTVVSLIMFGFRSHKDIEEDRKLYAGDPDCL